MGIALLFLGHLLFKHLGKVWSSSKIMSSFPLSTTKKISWKRICMKWVSWSWTLITLLSFLSAWQCWANCSYAGLQEPKASTGVLSQMLRVWLTDPSLKHQPRLQQHWLFFLTRENSIQRHPLSQNTSKQYLGNSTGEWKSTVGFREAAQLFCLLNMTAAKQNKSCVSPLSDFGFF